jgi:L-asparaginase II
VSDIEPVPLVRVVRTGLEESVHSGDVAVVDADAGLVAFAGDPERMVFARSSMKPLQATVSLSLAPFEFSEREVAVMCASHNGEPVHRETVRSILARADVREEALQCPAVLPMDEESAIEAPARAAINSDCSGKHAGMLAACTAQGWPLETYREPDHPLQQIILQTVLGVTGQGDVRVGVDGCGIPVHGMPLTRMALIYARLTAPERWGPLEGFARRAGQAMQSEPYMVAGRNRPDTALMQAVPGVVAKGGAEALICAAVSSRGLGVAVKVRDGGSRAAGPALLEVLRQLEVLDDQAMRVLEPFLRPPVLGGGRPVGELTPDLELRRP